MSFVHRPPHLRRRTRRPKWIPSQPGAAVEALRGLARGASLAVAEASSADEMLAQSRGATVSAASATATDPVSAQSRGAATTASVLSATDPVSAQARGAATTASELSSTDGLLARSHGAATTAAAASSTDPVSAEARGAATTAAVASSTDPVSGLARGATFAVASLTVAVVEQVSGQARGAAVTAARASAVDEASGQARGVTRTQAAVASTDPVSGTARGSTRSAAVATSFDEASGQARGATFAVASLTVAVQETASGQSRGATVTAAAASAVDAVTAVVRGASVTTAALAAAKPVSGLSRGASVTAASLTVVVPGAEPLSGTSRGATIAVATLSVSVPCTAGSPTDLDVRMGAAALRLLQRLGRDVEVTVLAGGTYDTTAGEVTGGSLLVTTERASPPIRYSDRFVDGDVIRRGDARIIFASLNIGFQPNEGVLIDVDGVTWTIVRVTDYFSGEQVAAYDCQLRGGGIPRLPQTSAQNRLDSRLPGKVRSLIRRRGKKVKYTAAVAQLYDPPTGGDPDVGTCEFCQQTVLDDHATQRDAGVTDERRRVTAYTFATDEEFMPYKGMRASYDSEDWYVNGVDAVYSGGKVALWQLELAR